ncbi:MAG: hypothetical protein JSS75_06085 [Bacteroidetes bacterium]|nr:hypothetical protein [Bacteroidota bacterium]
MDHLSYDSDGNVVLQPPAPGEGIQIMVDTFAVPYGKEIQGDFYFQLPNDVPIYVDHIEIAMNKGSHHMNCFKTDLKFQQGQFGDTTPVTKHRMMFTHDGKIDTVMADKQMSFYVTTVWNNSDMMVEAQVDHLNWNLATLPTDTSTPENLRGKQTVVRLEPHQNMIIENHYVNADVQTTPNGKGKIYINLYFAKSADIIPASMYVGRYVHLQIPPHSTDYAYPKNCVFPVDLPRPIYILGMTGHYHAHGKSFFVDVVRQKFDEFGQLKGYDSIPVIPKIYVNSTWNEPPFVSYDKPIKLDTGETLRYTAVFYNPSDTAVNFGGHVLYQEHDNLFAWFVPAWNNGKTVRDDND